MYCQSISEWSAKIWVPGVGLKAKPSISVNVSGLNSGNYSEDGSCVSLVLAASVSNFKFQQGNTSPKEYKDEDRGTGCVVRSCIYLPVWVLLQ